MCLPAGYLLTWTSYGTWLPGDDRGSVDLRHNTHGTDTLPPLPRLAGWTGVQLGDEPFTLSPEAREVVTGTVARHATHRGWRLEAVNARTNHVHCVLSLGSVRPEVMLRELKAWSTRDLRASGLLGDTQRAWTLHGSTRYLWNEENILAAVRYVRDGQ